MHVYIYIYICIKDYKFISILLRIFEIFKNTKPAFTVPEKKKRHGQEIKYLESLPGGKRKNYRSKRKKRPTSSDPLKKIKGYAVSWSKEN